MRGRLQEFWRVFNGQAHGDRAFEFVRRLWETDRWGDFTRFRETADTVATLFDSFGLDEVERVDVPADGRTRIGDWVMPMAWDCREATLEIVEPAVDQPIVARRSDVPNVAGQWCAPTGPDGLVADCVFLPDGDAAVLESLDVAGKLVCTAGQSREIRRHLAAKGAAGCVTCWTRNDQLVDATQWINVASDRPGGWGLIESDAPLMTLAISRRQMRRLEQLARQHGRLQLRARVDAQLYQGTLPYVSARLAGSDACEEEVILLGHLYEQGANDNCSGCATVLEIARVLAALVADGRIDRPRRSIRFLLMAESYGSLAYAQNNLARMKRTVAGLCIDTGAGPAALSRCGVAINATPLCSRSFLDAWHLLVANEYVRRYAPMRRVDLTDFALGTDQLFNDPAIGTPTNWAMLGSADDVWHTSADDLATIDAQALGDLAAIEGATAYTIATAADEEAAFIGQSAADHELACLTRRLRERTVAAQPMLSDGVTTVLVDTVERAVGSAARLAESDRGARNIKATARAARERAVQAVASSREAQERLASAGGRVEDGDAALNAMVPRRMDGLIGSVSLDTVPVEQWADGGVARSPRWGGPRTMAWWWADGHRTAGQIHDAVLAECDSLGGVDLAEYFRFLAKHGYVTI